MSSKKEQTQDCDCISTVAEKIKETIISKQSEKQKGFQLISGEWEYKSWYPKSRLYSNFIIKSTFEKKDGSTSKLKNNHVNIYYTFCPFCGKKIEE